MWGYNAGIRDRYDYTEAMLCNSLFYYYMRKHGLRDYKGESTRDIICMQFGFGTRSYEEEISHLTNMRRKANDGKLTGEELAAKLAQIDSLFAKVNENKDLYVKMTKERLREIYYEDGVDIRYSNINHKTGEIEEETIHYVMLYRNPSKAKTGEVMFINEKLYDVAYEWLTMGLGRLMPEKDAMIVELSAYAPLVTSTIVDSMNISLDEILILKDCDSFFRTMADVVESEDYMIKRKVLNKEKTKAAKDEAIKFGILNKAGKPIYEKVYDYVDDHMSRRCRLITREVDVKNTLWDGMALIESGILPESVNGMALLRNHFFKACAFNTNIQLFFRDWCAKTGNDYETYEVTDMFGNSRLLKSVKLITTDNAIKWKKFAGLMGGDLNKAYRYWAKRIRADGECWGIVKTDHESKLGSNLQQMSYQMINTLPCTYNDMIELTSGNIEYVQKLKTDNGEFLKFLRRNANEINHYNMLADLYIHNPEFAESKYFRTERRKVITDYVYHLRKGKIMVNGDNLTACGNPYALLLYCVGEDWRSDPTLRPEPGVIQCYTTRFEDGEYLGAFRSPHNSSNNLSYFRNVRHPVMDKYFNFSRNIIAVNCIETDIQARCNGMDSNRGQLRGNSFLKTVGGNRKAKYMNFLINIYANQLPMHVKPVSSMCGSETREVSKAAKIFPKSADYYMVQPYMSISKPNVKRG